MAAGRVKIPPRPAPGSDAREFSHSLGVWERGPHKGCRPCHGLLSKSVHGKLNR